MAKSKTSIVYEGLKNEVLNGIHTPGQKMKIDMLCETHSASPGAVREALARLTSEGLVVAADQRGFVVAPISAEDLIDLTRVRIEVENQCLRRAIEVGDLDWESNIAAAWHRLAKLDPVIKNGETRLNPEWAAAHNQFHDCLVAGGDSRWWLNMRDQLYVQAERYRRLLAPFAKVPRDSEIEHQSIVDAVLAHKPDVACELMRAHIQKTADMLLDSEAFAEHAHQTSAPETS